MNTWLLRFCRVLGLLLLLVTATSVLLPDPTTDQRTGSLALRQIGHDYLTACGDVNSHIPAVQVRTDGSMLLALATDVAYDRLNTIAVNVLRRYGINQDYTLSLEDCASGEVFLGSLWPAPQPEGWPGSDLLQACIGRDQPSRCANIVLAFAPAEATNTPVWTWLLGGIGFLLLFARPHSPQAPTKPEPTEQVAPVKKVNSSVSITSDCVFDLTAGTITVGSKTQSITHREGKLLAYFAASPNNILQRTAINDAVWGSEGIITGRSLDVFVSRLRKKLTEAEAVEIKTVHGVGYQLVVG